MSIGVEIKKTGVEHAAGFDVAHGRQQRFFEAWVVAFEIGEDVPKAPANGAGFLRTAAGNDRSAQTCCVVTGEVLGDIDERSNKAELVFAGPSDGRKCADATGEHGVAEKRFAEIVGGVTECDDVGAELAGEVVDGSATEATANVTAMAGLTGEKVERRAIFDIGPINPAIAEEGTHGLNRREKFTLFDGEGADRKVNRCALLKKQQGFQQSNGIFTAGEADCHTIAFADHTKAADGFAYFAEDGLFEVHILSLPV